MLTQFDSRPHGHKRVSFATLCHTRTTKTSAGACQGLAGTCSCVVVAATVIPVPLDGWR